MSVKVESRELKHRISLCTSADVVTTDGELFLVRKDVLQTWAKVDAKLSSMFSKAGYNIMENRERQTHLITMRMRRDMDITSAAWVFEERRQSGARWFKVLGIKEDDGSFIQFSARLVERGEGLTPPAETTATVDEIFQRVDQGVSL